MSKNIHLAIIATAPLWLAACGETATETAEEDAEAMEATEEAAEEAMAEGEEPMDGEMATGGDDPPDDYDTPF